ncbi:MAG: molybdopterin-dependent oxidoreductase [Nitrospirota bacterium]
MTHRLTTCTFCGVGCGLYLETSNNHVVGVSPSMSHPANQGRICLRGWNVHEIISSPDRLKTPLIRKNGKLQEASWDEAFAFIASRLTDIRKQHGPDSVALLNSPRCSNEESYLMQKLARAVLKTNNVDHGAGVYSNYSLNVLLKMMGVAASTNSIQGLNKSEVIIVDGVDLGLQLPTIGGTVIRAKLNGAKLIVIDWRRHRIAESADLFLQHKPGTETQLYCAMTKVIVDRGLMNLPFIKERCSKYEAFLEKLNEYDLLAASEICGVPAALIEEAALAYAQAASAAILYSTGIDSGDPECVEAMVNLCLLAGQIGKEGAGIYALTEQNNLQGVCDMGMLPDRLPGYNLVTDERARKQVEKVWKTDIPSKPGLTAKAILTDRGRNTAHAVWLCRYDPVSTAFIGNAVKSLQECELVVVQHLFLTETTKYAHVVLPTTVFGEELVTFTSSERRIQLAKNVIEPPQGITTAWQQFIRLANMLGADWKYASSADVMDEIGEVVSFYSGAHYDNLLRDYGRQWPCTKDHPMGTEILFRKNGPVRAFTFAPVEWHSQTVVTDEKYPLMLVFGHSLYYWNQNVLIKHSETLKREYRMLLLDYPDGFVEINIDDAKKLGIRDGQKIRIKAATGSAVTTARLAPEVRSGSVFVPYFVSQVQQQIRSAYKTSTQLIPVSVEKEAE